MKKTIGILGGMGPAATVELFNRIVNKTKAKYDKDHINIVIINDPEIPDRSLYISGNGESPLPRLKKNIDKLQSVGVDFILMPCMTAHSLYDQLNDYADIDVINAINLVDRFISSTPNTINNVGLLATDGSVMSKVFEKYISKKIVKPEKQYQNFLMSAIYDRDGLKAGNLSKTTVDRVFYVLDHLKEMGIDAVIAGCTELSLVLNETNAGIQVIDPLDLLAQEAIRLSTS